MIRKFICLLMRLFHISSSGTVPEKKPWIHLKDGLYFSREIDGFSISKLDENKKTVFNVLVSQTEKDSIVEFLNN